MTIRFSKFVKFVGVGVVFPPPEDVPSGLCFYTYHLEWMEKRGIVVREYALKMLDDGFGIQFRKNHRRAIRKSPVSTWPSPWMTTMISPRSRNDESCICMDMRMKYS